MGSQTLMRDTTVQSSLGSSGEDKVLSFLVATRESPCEPPCESPCEAPRKSVDQRI
jgi:hypothetical protein